MLERDERDPPERRTVGLRDAHESLRARAGNETFDLALEHERNHDPLAQGKAAKQDHGHGDDRAEQQRPHENAPPQKEAKDALGGVG